MRSLFAIALLWLPFIMVAQTRIAIDFSSRGNQILPTILFLKVVKHNYYIKTGISAGTFGAGEKEGRVIGPGPGYDNNEYEPITSSYREMNFPEDTDAKLVYYKEWNRGVAFEGGLGRFFEFGNTHTLRIDLQFRTYFLKSLVVADYDPLHGSNKNYRIAERYFHFAVSLGPEIFHAVRFTNRLTGYYGFKIPVFLPFNSKNYERLSGPSPIKGIKPMFSLGLSYGIGKKRSEKILDRGLDR